MKKTDGWVFIVNPIAGNGFGATLVDMVREMMKRHGASGDVVLTKSKGHATDLAAEHADKGFPIIVGVGGDGTLSEIAQALVARKGVTFGAVSAGTGNDFIHVLGFPDRFQDAQWQALFEGATADMDVGRCNGRYFINGMGLGFDAQVAAENYHLENGGEVRRGSKSKYMWHIVKNILLYKERRMRVTMDGITEERRNFLNTIGNGRRLAGGLMLTPRAIANDGKLDYCSTDALSIPQRFGAFSAVSKQTHLSRPEFHYAQTARIECAFDEEVPAHLDGELMFAERFEIDVLPGAVRSIIDPRGGHYFQASPA
jgi:YegS/Rv2252/BmrU family lipid kinase